MVLAVGFGSALTAQTVPLIEDLTEVRVEVNGNVISIQRDQAIASRYSRQAKLPWNCPPDCIQPLIAAPGVTTIAELETIAFLETMVSTSLGLLIDTRAPGQFAQGTIPGAVNVPTAALAPGNPYLGEILLALGAQTQGGALNFDTALDLTVFGAGPSSDQAVRTIDNLLAAGYPASKIRYYRGGMQDWQSQGLSLSVHQNEG
ncbi:rhodanese-like domain-containing protein [Flavimaricola marinus]|uniref:Rhodanese-like domain protein n=1 Tax=Flavimaricola marinus TaxID=1819565 RepID=A0A238LA41_9RHOB|nr:rhodanese-like domain-containing protein [Flavimaricola marinus]SMY06518.1 Rhodanese-like domain protein [Flavimaricola marinus]